MFGCLVLTRDCTRDELECRRSERVSLLVPSRLLLRRPKIRSPPGRRSESFVRTQWPTSTDSICLKYTTQAFREYRFSYVICFIIYQIGFEEFPIIRVIIVQLLLSNTRAHIHISMLTLSSHSSAPLCLSTTAEHSQIISDFGADEKWTSFATDERIVSLNS